EVIDYLKKAPQRMRKELEIILRNFNGGPVVLEKVAIEAEIPVSIAYSRLEALVVSGLLEKDKAGRYYVPRDAMKIERKEEREIKEDKFRKEEDQRRIPRSILRLKRVRKGFFW
ncbi:MAG: hypothetical protein QW187_04455, partial [Candidatus Korarchaeum sp.]